MADKYIDTSLTTGNNDGTSPANAWQDFFDVWTGAFATSGGTLDAGDRVIIRANDGAVDLDAVTNSSVSNGTPGAYRAPVTYIVDDGTVWPANDGVFTIRITSGSLTIRGHVILDGNGGRLRIYGDYSSGHATVVIATSSSSSQNISPVFKDCLIETTNTGGDRRIDCYHVPAFIGCTFRLRNKATSSSYGSFRALTGARPRFFGCTIDMVDSSSSGTLITASSNSAGITWYACKVTNADISQKLILSGTFDADGAGTNNTVQFYNCDFDVLTNTYGVDSTFDFMVSNSQFAENANTFVNHGISGRSDFVVFDNKSLREWKETGNYPVLNAIFPDDAATGWSIKVLPSNLNNQQSAAHIYDMLKFWTGAAAALVVKAEILLADTSLALFDDYSNPTKQDIYITVTYTDSTGVVRCEDSFVDGLLETSSAAWSSTIYGANSYNKYKVQLTTSHQVAADSSVRVSLYMGLAANSVNHFLFLCPDPVLVVAP